MNPIQISVIVLFLIWMILRQWKMRKIVMAARKLKSKYIAYPVIGHGLMFMGSTEDIANTIQKFCREAFKNKYSMTGIWLGPEFYFAACDPVIIDVVTKNCLEKSDVSRFARFLTGNGSVFAPVNIWRPRRKFLAPTFSMKNLIFFVKVFAQQSQLMASCLKGMSEAGDFSIWKHITNYTIDSVCITTLGVNMNAQLKSSHPVLKAFADYCSSTSERIMKIWLQWDPLYKCLPAYAADLKNKKIIHDMVHEVIRKKRFSLEQKNGGVEKDLLPNEGKDNMQTFLELLLNSSNENEGYTDAEIREEILVIIFAGADTTAVGISFTILMLSRYPDVQEKVYEEICEIFGDTKRPVTEEDLLKLKYLEAVIKESMRLYPPVPMISRKNQRDIVLPSGITMPAGSNTAIMVWGCHRNPRYWGEDAEEFKPERFFKGSSLEHPAAYIPFSYGPRGCIGFQYAMMSMKVALATLLREYKVLPPSDIAAEDLKKPLRLSFDVMSKDVDNFRVRIESRT